MFGKGELIKCVSWKELGRDDIYLGSVAQDGTMEPDAKQLLLLLCR